MQMTDEQTRGYALLDLLFMNKEELVDDMKVKGGPGCNDHKTI